MNKISRTLTTTKVITKRQHTIADEPEQGEHLFIGKYTIEQAQKKIKKLSKDYLYEVVTDVIYSDQMYTMPIETFITYASKSEQK